MKKRYIFDLDGTLLHGDFSLTDDYFKSIYGEDATDLTNNMEVLLKKYERKNNRYEYDTLSRYLSMKTGLDIKPKIIKDWVYELRNVLDFKEDEITEVLESLKSSDKSLAVLTNWFGITQIARLEKAGLNDYFDEVYTGDLVLKPHRVSYYIATGDYHPYESIFIGNNVDLDYIGPKACGYDAILFDKDDIQHHTIQKIKKMEEILRIK